MPASRALSLSIDARSSVHPSIHPPRPALCPGSHSLTHSLARRSIALSTTTARESRELSCERMTSETANHTARPAEPVRAGDVRPAVGRSVVCCRSIGSPVGRWAAAVSCVRSTCAPASRCTYNSLQTGAK